jgi:hypothetical protein
VGTNNIHTLIQVLAENGWKVKTMDTAFLLPSNLTDRYPELPAEIVKILSGIDDCISLDDKSWLLCLPDYQGNRDTEFLWNEFECRSLEAAKGDKDWEMEIVDIWNNHFPVSISVRDGYEYAAISLAPISYGKIVAGREPEYEETTFVAANFRGFVQRLAR